MAASTSSTSPRKYSWSPGFSLQPRSDGNISTMPAWRKARAVCSFSESVSPHSQSPIDQLKPPWIQTMAGRFLPSLTTGVT
jgi:hypothetical protein